MSPKEDALELAQKITADGSWCAIGYDPDPELVESLASKLLETNQQLLRAENVLRQYAALAIGGSARAYFSAHPVSGGPAYD